MGLKLQLDSYRQSSCTLDSDLIKNYSYEMLHKYNRYSDLNMSEGLGQTLGCMATIQDSHVQNLCPAN